MAQDLALPHHIHIVSIVQLSEQVRHPTGIRPQVHRSTEHGKGEWDDRQRAEGTGNSHGRVSKDDPIE